MNIKRIVQKHLLDRGFVLNMTLRYLDRKREIDLSAYAGDYIRNSSLELVANEIYTNHVEGSVAELGVYKGDFAKIINELFPDRKLYLFDTFEGFWYNDTALDKSREYSLGRQDFSDTSIEIVLRKMKYPSNCVVRKGYFPATAAGLEDRFSFVSIDADLYQPTREGLRYFFPLLSKGGYLFVHDYNNAEYKGVREAVREYCTEHAVGYFPLSDACGSVVVSK